MISQAALVISVMLGSFSQNAVNCRSIDEVIMAAAHDVSMFDLVHIMDGGELMVMVELDMLMNMTEFSEYSQRSYRGKRKATSRDRRLWNNRIVPYEIIRSDFNNNNMRTIMRAMEEWQNYTCLTFREATNERDRISFRNGGGCYSRLGRTGGTQPIVLAPGCREKGVVIHEIGHAIGWIHEQARPDRDEFIWVNFNQIPRNWRSQFAKVAAVLINDRGVEYDYDSIMHYSGNVFGPRTIVTRDPTAQRRIGQRKGLSFRDIKLANLMYRCAQTNDCKAKQCPGEGFQGKDCKCYCPGNPVVLCEEKPVKTTPKTKTTTSVTSTTSTTTTTMAPTTLPPRQCMDVRKDCPTLKASNRCTTDAARMSIFCRRTCNLCNIDPSQACMDYDEACPLFAANGYCNATIQGPVTEYFRQECPLSCGICKRPDGCSVLAYPNASFEFKVSSVLMGAVLMFAGLTI